MGATSAGVAGAAGHERCDSLGQRVVQREIGPGPETDGEQ